METTTEQGHWNEAGETSAAELDLQGQLATLEQLCREMGIRMQNLESERRECVEVAVESAQEYSRLVNAITENDRDWEFGAWVVTEDWDYDNLDGALLRDDTLNYSVRFPVIDLPVVLERVRRANEKCWQQGG